MRRTIGLLIQELGDRIIGEDPYTGAWGNCSNEAKESK